MMPLKAIGGTGDVLPEEVHRWQQLESEARRLFHLYGFKEIRTPILEEVELFRRSLGAHTEIVHKQMYLFQDRAGREIALRPEGTAPAVRAFIEHGLDTTGGLTRWYYLGSMFRAERPQAGRRRQFHQMGVELFGSAAPYQDAEVIQLLQELLTTFGLDRFQLKLNSLGCRSDRKAMVEKIRGTFKLLRNGLCPECQERLEKNPLRILDCKEPSCGVRKHPVELSGCICPDCRSHFEKVLEALEILGLKREEDFVLDSSLVRGLDYYTKTTFEVTHPDLGAQNALGGGGRYDDLVESLGGTPTPAVGFAVGIERILMALGSQAAGADPPWDPPAVFVATFGGDSLEEGMKLLRELRKVQIPSIADYEGRPLKRQMEQANRFGCRFVLLLGEAERQKGVVALKDMTSGEQVELPRDRCVEEIQKKLKGSARHPGTLGSDP